MDNGYGLEKGKGFNSLSSLYPMSQQLHHIECTKDQLLNSSFFQCGLRIDSGLVDNSIG